MRRTDPATPILPHSRAQIGRTLASGGVVVVIAFRLISSTLSTISYCFGGQLSRFR